MLKAVEASSGESRGCARTERRSLSKRMKGRLEQCRLGSQCDDDGQDEQGLTLQRGTVSQNAQWAMVRLGFISGRLKADKDRQLLKGGGRL